MSQVFDCRDIAREFLDWSAATIRDLVSAPKMATVLYRPTAGPASRQYRDLIARDAARLGIPCESLEPEREADLLTALEGLNQDPDITGVVVLYPLGLPRRDEDVMDLVSPLKDIEGLHSTNLGYLIKYRRLLDAERGLKCVVPATAKAVVKTLQRYPAVRIEGAFVCVVNNSMRVGKPLGLMLENLGATVVKCYDKTPPATLEECVRRADILVTAVPAPGFSLDPLWVKRKAVVVDVSFQGNIDIGKLEDSASFVTSPSNRVGQVTRAMMFVNLLYCARARALGLHAAPHA